MDPVPPVERLFRLDRVLVKTLLAALEAIGVVSDGEKRSARFVFEVPQEDLVVVDRGIDLGRGGVRMLDHVMDRGA